MNTDSSVPSTESHTGSQITFCLSCRVTIPHNRQALVNWLIRESQSPKSDNFNKCRMIQIKLTSCFQCGRHPLVTANPKHSNTQSAPLQGLDITMGEKEAAPVNTHTSQAQPHKEVPTPNHTPYPTLGGQQREGATWGLKQPEKQAAAPSTREIKPIIQEAQFCAGIGSPQPSVPWSH